MDIERMIAIALFTKEVMTWAEAQAVLEVFAKYGVEVPEEVKAEVATLGLQVDRLLLTAPDWVVGRA